MSALIFTCTKCRSIVDYSCICATPPPISELTGHDTVEAAKAHVEAMASAHANHLTHLENDDNG